MLSVLGRIQTKAFPQNSQKSSSEKALFPTKLKLFDIELQFLNLLNVKPLHCNGVNVSLLETVEFLFIRL